MRSARAILVIAPNAPIAVAGVRRVVDRDAWDIPGG